MEETWEKWAPVPAINKKYNFVSIVNAVDDFDLILSNDLHTITINFDAIIFGHRRIKKEYSPTQYDKDWPFYRVKHSHFFNWITKESDESCLPETMVQFSFFTNQFVIDIVLRDSADITVTLTDSI